MIWLNEYKNLKVMAERYLDEEISLNIDIQIEIMKLKLKKISYDEAIENIIFILSGGEHQKLKTK